MQRKLTYRARVRRALVAIASLVPLLLLCDGCEHQTRQQPAAVTAVAPILPKDPLKGIFGKPAFEVMIEESEIGGGGMAFDYTPWNAQDLDRAEQYIRSHPDLSSFFLLRKLYLDSPQRYARVPVPVKAVILCQALQNIDFLNWFSWMSQGDWAKALKRNGSLACGEEDMGRALVGLGAPALPFLEPILDDTSEVAFFFNDTLPFSYKYRRCDFAYRYIELILGREPVFLATPEERDPLIARLKEELGRQKSTPATQPTR